MSIRSALDSYEARLAMARALYSKTCNESANLSGFNRVAAEILSFTTLQVMQQDAMRDLVSGEFEELLKLREKFLAPSSEVQRDWRSDR